MPPRTTRSTLACLLAGTVVTLAACSSGSDAGTSSSPTPNGVADLPAQQILDQATANAKAQSSVHLKGYGSCPAPIGGFFADMSLRHDGTGMGTVTIGTTQISLVSAPDALYVKAPATFWAAQAGTAKADTLAPKWVRLEPRTNPCFAALGSFSNVLDNYLGYPGTPVKQKSTSIQGVPAVLLEKPPGVSIWVASTGPVLPVNVTVDDGATKMGLSRWGADVKVERPPADQIVDGTTLKP